MGDPVENIQAALIKSYQATGLTSDDLTGWPNRKFSPPDAQFHAYFSIDFGDIGVRSFGVGGTDGTEGFAQVLLCYPLGSGTVQTTRDIATLRQAYRAGTRLESGGTWLTIRSCSPSPGVPDGEYYVVPVTIRWFSRFER